MSAEIWRMEGNENKNEKVINVYAMNANKVSRGITPLILNLGIRHR
jgi:hypothetical protein